MSPCKVQGGRPSIVLGSNCTAPVITENTQGETKGRVEIVQGVDYSLFDLAWIFNFKCMKMQPEKVIKVLKNECYS